MAAQSDLSGSAVVVVVQSVALVFRVCQLVLQTEAIEVVLSLLLVFLAHAQALQLFQLLLMLGAHVFVEVFALGLGNHETASVVKLVVLHADDGAWTRLDLLDFERAITVNVQELEAPLAVENHEMVGVEDGGDFQSVELQVCQVLLHFFTVLAFLQDHFSNVS